MRSLAVGETHVGRCLSQMDGHVSRSCRNQGNAVPRCRGVQIFQDLGSEAKAANSALLSRIGHHTQGIVILPPTLLRACQWRWSGTSRSKVMSFSQ